MKSRFAIYSLFSLTVITTVGLLITGSSAASETSPQLPVSCFRSSTNSSRPVDPDRGCSGADDVIECPASAPNIFYSQKDYVNGDLIIKDNIQTILCVPNNAPELLDPYKCKKPNGTTYYSKMLCLGYLGSNNTSIYDEIIQCPKDYTLTNGTCFKNSSPSPNPEPMACTPTSTQYYRMSDKSCQPQSNCWDKAHPDYNIRECQGVRNNMPPPPPPPPPPPGPSDQCPRKPDPAKGTAEPAAIPDGYEIKAVPSYYLWGCYSQPDKSAGECTAQATKRTGNATSPCVAGEESIICPSKGTAYKDGNFLKCAPLKKVEGGKDDGKKIDKTPEPTIITQTVERIVTVEVPSTISVIPPTIVTEESCKKYKDEVGEILIQGDVFLGAADASFKSTVVRNPEFKKAFYQILLETTKNRRKLKKTLDTSACNGGALGKIDSATKDFETVHIEKVKQAVSVLEKTTQVQNQYVGIQEDFSCIEKSPKSSEDLKMFEEAKADLRDILDAEKEGKVFSFEMENMAERASELCKKTSATLQEKGVFLKKGNSGIKEPLKKSAKSKKKTTKKTTKSKKPAQKTK